MIRFPSRTALLGKRGTGWLRDSPDPRDMLLSAAELATTPPPEHLPRHGLPPLYQEGNSCTGRIVHYFRIGEVNHGRDPGELSGLHNYYTNRIAWGGLTFDNGSYIREACKALMKYGAAQASLWPETAWNVQRGPSARAQRSAQKFDGARGYFRTFGTDLDGIRRVIASGFTVFGGWHLDEAFLDPRGPVTVGEVRYPSGSLGHAIGLDGYDRFGRFHSPASWRGWRGTEYVDAGCWLTEEFVAQGYDLWAVISRRPS